MKIKKILISQPEPANLEKSPYRNLAKKNNVELTFYKFFEVVGIPASTFRRTRIHISDYTAIIFNSKNSIEHFFRMMKEMRETVSEDMKYFCTSEAIALYLQNFILYRKRKVFYGNQYFSDLIEVMSKHRDEKFLFPCSDEKQTEYTKALDKAKFKYTKAPMYTSQPRDLTQFDIDSFDIIALFSPIGVRSLIKSFPDIKDHNVTIAAFGTSTHAALKENGIKLSIAAPTQSSPSMAMAIENYLSGKTPDTVVITRTDSSRRSNRNSVATTTKRSRPVIANKEVYKQRMEEKKAQAAARRAAREAEKAKKEAELQNPPEQPIEKKTVTKKPIEKKTVEKKVSEKKTVEKKPVEKKTIEQKAATPKTVEKKAVKPGTASTPKTTVVQTGSTKKATTPKTTTKKSPAKKV